MPTYEYACKACGEHLEVVQSFKDEALTECPNCGGELRKVFGAIGIAFKGSGFYRNDSRPQPKESKESKESRESKTSKESKEKDAGEGSKEKVKSKSESAGSSGSSGSSGDSTSTTSGGNTAKSDSKSAASS